LPSFDVEVWEIIFGTLGVCCLKFKADCQQLQKENPSPRGADVFFQTQEWNVWLRFERLQKHSKI
jgi:hypothetical protein